VSTEQHGKNQRREGVGYEHGEQLQVDAPGIGQHEEAFDRGQLGEEDAVDESEAGVAVEGLRMVDP
jgi:hypothetical protein